MSEKEIQQMVSSLTAKGSISRRELHLYFLDAEGALTTTTLSWRIHELKQKNIIQELQTGFYTLAVKPVYTPNPGHPIKKIDKLLTDRYPGASHCSWNIDWLNEFTVHQFTRDTIIVETERDLVESVGYTLVDNGFHNVLWQVRGAHLSFAQTKDPIFLLPLITRAPLQQISMGKRRSVSCPTLEKILVDIYDDNKIFHFLQGAEMERIFDHALRRYAINWTTLFGYAKRRGKEDVLRAFVGLHFSDIRKNIVE